MMQQSKAPGRQPCSTILERHRGGRIASLLAGIVLIQAASALEFHVSPAGNDANPGTADKPFKTLEQAKAAARAARPLQEDVAVVLRGGIYALGKTLEFGPQDGGGNGFKVRYQAHPGEKPILSGGVRLGGWQMQSGGRNIWKAQLPAGLVPRQLFVDTFRAVRARSQGPLPGATQDATGHTSTDASIAGWPDAQDMEVVYRMHWTSPRCQVQSARLEGGKTRLVMAQPGWNTLLTQGNPTTRPQAPWYYENAFALMDQAGEWYADRAKREIHYMPRPGEDPSRAEFRVPVLDLLVSVAGAQDLEFRGLVFAHAAWSFVDSVGYLRDAQSNINRTPLAGKPPERLGGASVAVSGKGVTFERCDFTQSGGAGLNLVGPVTDILVQGCRFFRLSGSGIQVGEPERSSPEVGNIRILNNYIHHIGEEYYASVAVFGAFTDRLEISHNEMGFLPYSGITVGWQWNNSATQAKANLFRANYIHDLVRELRDAAGIYTLGAQPGTVWEGNYVQRVVNDYGCYYPDQGSKGHTIRGNVCSEVKRWLHIWTSSITGNTVTGNFTDSPNINNSGSGNTVTNNTTVAPGNWPPAAQAIIAAAGLEASYRDLRTAPDPFSQTVAVRISEWKPGSGKGLESGSGLEFKHGRIWAKAKGRQAPSLRPVDAGGRVLPMGRTMEE